MTEKETPFQQVMIPASNILVFHPGSRNLRFGRASESKPHVILHAIGRRRKINNPGNVHFDTMLPKICEGRFPPEVESARLQLCHTLQTELKDDGTQRYSTPIPQIAALNKKSDAEHLSPKNQKSWNNYIEKGTIFGDEIININPKGDFNLHFPWARGKLNLHQRIGGSLSSILQDFEDIWTFCIQEKLGIPINELMDYRAVVIIPTNFDKVHARELMNIVITKMGFGGAFLCSDHICATFGAGLACCCVVDIGSQKISVSCVEDAISVPNSRIDLKYGGDDLTIAFWNLLNQSEIPFKIDFTCPWDANFLSNLKENYCHLDLNRCGPEEITIIWDKPEDTPLRYKIHLADELLIIPLSFFNPDLLKGSIEPKPVSSYRAQPSHSDDPYDDMFITETSRKGIKENEDGEEMENEDETHENIVKVSSKIDSDALLGLDQAILQSIESCNLADEIKRRFFSTILIVGNGFKFKGTLASWLHKKIAMNSPLYKLENQEIITHPKDGDPGDTVWKGASILSTLDSSNELWINPQEWNAQGFKVLREKSLCQF